MGVIHEMMFLVDIGYNWSDDKNGKPKVARDSGSHRAFQKQDAGGGGPVREILVARVCVGGLILSRPKR